MTPRVRKSLKPLMALWKVKFAPRLVEMELRAADAFHRGEEQKQG